MRMSIMNNWHFQELDDIENFLNRTGGNGERHVRLKELSKSLIEKGRNIFSATTTTGSPLTNPIAKEAFNLSERWETLAQKAMERTAILEGAKLWLHVQNQKNQWNILLFLGFSSECSILKGTFSALRFNCWGPGMGIQVNRRPGLVARPRRSLELASRTWTDGWESSGSGAGNFSTITYFCVWLVWT